MSKFSFKFHWSFIVLGLVMIYFGEGLLYFCYTITVILHEMGHAFVGRSLGYKLNIIRLMPYGASLSGNNAPFKTRDELLIALGGPVINIIIILIISSLWWFYPSSFGYTQTFFSTNLSTLIFNILPIFPLDGGRLLVATLGCKLSRKKAFKITKIVGFIFTGLIFLSFFLSFFSQLNYTLGINAILLLIGLFDDDKTCYYINIKDVDKKSEQLQRGLLLKTIAISENSSIYDAYRLLDKNNVNQIYVMDDNYKVKRCIDEVQLQKWIFSLPLDTKLKDL